MKFATLAGLACALVCSSQAQTLQWSTALPADSSGGKFVLAGNQLYVTSTPGLQNASETLYQVSESGTLTGSLTLYPASFGAQDMAVQDVTSDSSGNVYILLSCTGNSAGTNNFSVVKVNSSLSQVWATSLVSGTVYPLKIQLGSSGNPFVLAYNDGNYDQVYSFASNGTLNAGQPFEFPVAFNANAYASSLAVINANGAYPDEPYVFGNGQNPNQSGASGGFVASPLLPISPLWIPSARLNFNGNPFYSEASAISAIGTDNKYVYIGATATFPYPNAAPASAPLWSFCGSDGDFPSSGIWNRTFVSTTYTVTPSLVAPLYDLSPSQISLDNEHDILYAGACNTQNGAATGVNTAMFVECQSDITGLGKSGSLIRSDSVGLASYPFGCVGVGASVGKGIAWALGVNGSNALFKFTDNATTFAFLGAISPASMPVNTIQNYYGLAVNPSTGEAYVLGNGYVSDYK